MYKWVKYIGNGVNTYTYPGLTLNKVYETLQYGKNSSGQYYLIIRNDDDDIEGYHLHNYHSIALFEDVTKECRGDIIDEILM